MKEEYKSLVEELNNLSTNFEKNKERMKEIAHILVTYYMGGGKTVKDVEKSSQQNDQKNTA